MLLGTKLMKFLKNNSNCIFVTKEFTYFARSLKFLVSKQITNLPYFQLAIRLNRPIQGIETNVAGLIKEHKLYDHNS